MAKLKRAQRKQFRAWAQKRGDEEFGRAFLTTGSERLEATAKAHAFASTVNPYTNKEGREMLEQRIRTEFGNQLDEVATARDEAMAEIRAWLAANT